MGNTMFHSFAATDLIRQYGAFNVYSTILLVSLILYAVLAVSKFRQRIRAENFGALVRFAPWLEIMMCIAVLGRRTPSQQITDPEYNYGSLYIRWLFTISVLYLIVTLFLFLVERAGNEKLKTGSPDAVQTLESIEDPLTLTHPDYRKEVFGQEESGGQNRKTNSEYQKFFRKNVVLVSTLYAGILAAAAVIFQMVPSADGSLIRTICVFSLAYGAAALLDIKRVSMYPEIRKNEFEAPVIRAQSPGWRLEYTLLVISFIVICMSAEMDSLYMTAFYAILAPAAEGINMLSRRHNDPF